MYKVQHVISYTNYILGMYLLNLFIISPGFSIGQSYGLIRVGLWAGDGNQFSASLKLKNLVFSYFAACTTINSAKAVDLSNMHANPNHKKCCLGGMSVDQTKGR